MGSTIIWDTNGQGWNRDKGAVIVNMPLKEVLVVHDGWRIFVQSFLNMLSHGYFHIWKCRGSRLLGICGKEGSTLELMKNWFVGCDYRNIVLYFKMQFLLTAILSIQLIPLSLKVVVHWDCPLKDNDFYETNTLLHYYWKSVTFRKGDRSYLFLQD